MSDISSHSSDTDQLELMWQPLKTPLSPSSKIPRSGLPVNLMKYWFHSNSSILWRCEQDSRRQPKGNQLRFVGCHSISAENSSKCGKHLDIRKLANCRRGQRRQRHRDPRKTTYCTDGHIRRPWEKTTIRPGRSLSTHLSGSNFSGSGYTAGSICTKYDGAATTAYQRMLANQKLAFQARSTSYPGMDIMNRQPWHHLDRPDGQAQSPLRVSGACSLLQAYSALCQNIRALQQNGVESTTRRGRWRKT